MKHLYSSLVAAGFLALAVSAQANVIAGTNDLILGFRESTNVGNLEIKLASTVDIMAHPGVYSLGNIDAVLTTAYGSNWENNSTLVWGVAGSTGAGQVGLNGDPASTAYGTKKWTSSTGTLGLKNSTAFTAVSTSGLNTAASKILTVAQASLFNATEAQTLDSRSVFVPTAGNAWTTQQGTSGFTTLGSSTLFNNAVTNLTTLGQFSASDLYKVKPNTAGEFMGTFVLATNGDLSFVTIPEPSTYAMILGALTLGLVAVRRRLVKQA